MEDHATTQPAPADPLSCRCAVQRRHERKRNQPCPMPGCSYAAVHIGDLRSHVKKCKKALGSAKRQAVRGVDGRPMARPAAEMPEPDSLSQLLGLIDLLPRPTGQAPDLAPAPMAVPVVAPVVAPVVVPVAVPVAMPVPAEDPAVVWL